eukprot:COSAG05_NODE_330_length_11274_cov_4.167696_2_plen_533_part_00
MCFLWRRYLNNSWGRDSGVETSTPTAQAATGGDGGAAARDRPAPHRLRQRQQQRRRRTTATEGASQQSQTPQTPQQQQQQQQQQRRRRRQQQQQQPTQHQQQKAQHQQQECRQPAPVRRRQRGSVAAKLTHPQPRRDEVRWRGAGERAAIGGAHTVAAESSCERVARRQARKVEQIVSQRAIHAHMPYNWQQQGTNAPEPGGASPPHAGGRHVAPRGTATHADPQHSAADARGIPRRLAGGGLSQAARAGGAALSSRLPSVPGASGYGGEVGAASAAAVHRNEVFVLKAVEQQKEWAGRRSKQQVGATTTTPHTHTHTHTHTQRESVTHVTARHTVSTNAAAPSASPIQLQFLYRATLGYLSVTYSCSCGRPCTQALASPTAREHAARASREEDEAARLLLDARLARFKAGEADFERRRAEAGVQVSRSVGLDPSVMENSRPGDHPVYSPPKERRTGFGGRGGRRRRQRIGGARSAPAVSLSRQLAEGKRVGGGGLAQAPGRESELDGLYHDRPYLPTRPVPLSQRGGPGSD